MHFEGFFCFFSLSHSWREGVIVLPTSTFLDNLVLDDPEKETAGDPSAGDPAVIPQQRRLLFQGQESSEHQPLEEA